MTGTSRKNPVLANPFYVGLMVLGTLFVVTVMAWLVSAHELALDSQRVAERALPPRHEGMRTFASWLDRHGPLIVGIEFVLMLAAGVLAMVTEDWFMAARASDQGTRGKEGRKQLSDK
jgi:hypothetical protein